MSRPRYIRLWLGQLVSSLSDSLNGIAPVVLVFRLSQSGIAVFALVVTEIVPTLTPRRYRKRRVTPPTSGTG